MKKLTKLIDEDIFEYAASLSFHTILSIVPLFIISFSIFTKLPNFEKYYKKLEKIIFSNILPSNQEIVKKYLETFLFKASNMGLVGAIFIIAVSILFFYDYEKITSKILKKERRGFWNSFSTYWTFITFFPIGVSISIFASSYIETFVKDFSYILPFLISWITFFVIYSISINEKGATKRIFIISFIIAAIWNLSKSAFILYVKYNKTYLSLYGSFSTLMFFLIWIYFSWIIFLVGIKWYKT